MAGGSKWSVTGLAVVAGMFAGAALTRYNDRKTADPSSWRDWCDRSGSSDPPNPSASDANSGALTRKGLEARVDGLFSVVYLTLMAIIQGAAFGLLFLMVQMQLMRFMWSAHTVLVLVQAFATAMAIVIVTQEYLLLMQISWWTPTVFDTLIPYLLGFGEIWMALAVGHSTSWWIALCSLCGGAILAFSYTASRNSAPVPGRTIENMDKLKGTILIQIVLSAVMLITSLTLAILNYSRAQPTSLNIALTGAVTLIGALIVIVGQYTQNEVYKHYGLPRWHPFSRRNHS